MSSPFGHQDRWTLLFSFMTALATISSIGSTAVTMRLATTVLLSSPIVGLAVAASAITIFSLCTLLIATFFFLKHVSRRVILVIWVPGLLSCVIGSVLTLITLAGTIRLIRESRLDGNGSSTRRLADVGLAFGLLRFFAEVAFYVLTTPRHETSPEITGGTEDRPSPTRSAKRPSITVHLSSLSPGPSKFFTPCSEPTSPSFSSFSNSPTSSLPDSVNQALQPMASKMRLLLGTSLSLRESGSLPSGDLSIEKAVRNNNEDFAGWDTSAVEDRFEKPLRSKTKPSKLETIPGSRPVSPAHPLEGPFDDHSAPEDAPLPESPTDSSASCTSSSSSMPVGNVAFPNVTRTDSNDQQHIHPLFRTESPVPPPLASPRTVITASPYAGQIVSSEVVLGHGPLTSSTASRPPTPNAALSPVKRRPGSSKSFRIRPTLPQSPALDMLQRSLSRSSMTDLSRIND